MLKLLIVDDERDVRIGLGQYFPWASFGYEMVSTAANAAEALKIIESTHIDVMLCDIKMPGMNGLELVAYIQQKNYAITTVILSGYRDFEYAQKAMEYGVKRFLLKPTKQQELIEVFQKLHNELKKANDEQDIVQKAGIYNLEHISNPTIQKIIQYIDENLKIVSLETLATYLSMNPSYISSFFKEKTGLNFSDYVNYIRMENAAKLLSSSTYKAYEISEIIGYSNAKHFTKKFNSYFGMSPIEYRNKGKHNV